MPYPRKIAFVTAATDHGTLIINRYDYHSTVAGRAYGVGIELLERASREANEINLAQRLLELRRKYFGDGVVAIDGGANIGTHTVEWAKAMTGWGSVLAIEAQERIYYALAGNIAINNCFNARAIHGALAQQRGIMKIPTLDYTLPGSFGSFGLKDQNQTNLVGQAIDTSEANAIDVQAVSVDSLGLDRVDLIKLDIEGMELEALEGATHCIASSYPILMVEWTSSDKNRLRSWMENLHYSVFEQDMNFIAVHQTDKCLEHINKM